MTASEVMTPAEARALANRLGEDSWLADLRARGLERYLASELPHRADHLWRYTDPAEFEAKTDPFGQEHDRRSAIEFETLPAGVTATSFDRAPRALLERVLARTVGVEFGRFEALNAASFRQGTLIHVAKNAVVEAPIRLRVRVGAGAFHASRTAILVEEGASVTLMEELVGGADESAGAKATQQVSHVSEMVVEAQAAVHHVLIETLGRRCASLVTQRARLARGAKIHPILAAFGGALTKADVGVTLEGEGAESEMSGFLSGQGRQRFDHHTVHHHLARHTRSNLNFRTVLSDRARSAYTGLIRIEKEASYSEAYQENRNLLLSKTCRADSIPELEILTQEVQCKHGATVGPLDPAHLFYLMSRAIPREEAIRMIVAGHFEETLRDLPESLREPLEALLLSRLRGR